MHDLHFAYPAPRRRRRGRRKGADRDAVGRDTEAPVDSPMEPPPWPVAVQADEAAAQDSPPRRRGPPPAVLRGASLEVPAGESGFLLGPSGCGKTTLLRCIAGLESEYAGTVAWRDGPLDDLPPHRRGVGMLFQEPALFPHLSVWRNVAFGLRYRAVARREQREEALRWLDIVRLGDHVDDAVDELSGGQRQRVALARTLAAKPRIVMLDEPLASLDRDLREMLGPEVKSILAKQGVAALWVTHDREEAVRLGDRVWRMEGGRCVAVSRPDEDTS